MKRKFCRLIASVAPETSAGGIRVLLYHAIGDSDPADRLALRVSRQRFLEQLRLLRDDGYRVVPLGALCGPDHHDNQRRVAITFDDGYRSQGWAAMALREFEFPATFFVVPRYLDGMSARNAYWEKWGYLRWDDAAALIDDGFEVGAHSATHSDLRRCADSQLDHEISGTRRLLEDRFRRNIVSFSYPFGRHDVRVRDAVERAGYQLACTSRYGVNRRSGPFFAVRRTEVSGLDDIRDFRMKLQGKYDWLGCWQDLRST